MPKVRVYQLAKELQVQSALILELLDRMGQEVKSDLSPLEDSTVDAVREKITTLIAHEKERLAEEQKAAEDAAPVEEPISAVAEPAADAEETAPAAPAEPAETEPVPVAAKSPEAETPAAAAKPAAPPQAPAVAARTTETILPPGARKPRVFPARRIPTAEELRRQAQPARARAQTTATLPPMPGRPGPGRPGPPRPPGFGRPGPPSSIGLGKRRKKKTKHAELRQQQMPAKPKPELPPVPEKITLSEVVTAKELAEKLNRKSKDVIAEMIKRGVLATINQPLDPETAIEVARSFGSTASIVSFEEEEAAGTSGAGASTEAETAADHPEDLLPRPPVVTVMGHVDHGKTSLLDSIRTTNVVAGEHGGITQHIGAYQVEKNGRKITFLDTPGHEAFTMMRARGAKATDVVVLVVAADDGVKPQTLESIDHARAAEVPMVVAINKIDKPEANPDRVKQQLADRELLVEQYGGEIVSVDVSAKKGTGIDDLLEMILLVADIGDLVANPDKLATGVVLEARVDRARGVLATVIVQEGTLKVGDPFIAGSAFGKVRAMTDEHGQRVEQAGPSTPVELMGFTSEPAAGDHFQAVGDESRARQIASFRKEKERAAALQRKARHVTLESLSNEIAAGQGARELHILLKADVQGSLEALQKSLGELPQDKIRLNLLRGSTGAITQADVLLASASNAIIVGFNVRADRSAADLGREEEVEVRQYTIIYDLINEIRAAMVGLLEPIKREAVVGAAEVRQVFKVPKIGMIAGSYVTDGKVSRKAEVRLYRDNVLIYTGKVGSLRRFKDDVAEVKSGFECGIGIENYNDLKEGDVIEFFVIEEIAVESL